jgi:hypothetical protein
MRERREFIETWSTFQAMDFEPNIDYRRKHGLVEDINHAVGQADDDARMYEESLKNRKRLEPGAIEMPLPQGPPPPGLVTPGPVTPAPTPAPGRPQPQPPTRP